MEYLICTSTFDKKNIVKKLLDKKIKIKFNPYGRKLNESELYNLIDQKTVGLFLALKKLQKY